MVLARCQQGSKLFDNLSSFRLCFFMNTLPILMGISAFLMRVAPIILFQISAPPFSLFFKRPLKGANMILLVPVTTNSDLNIDHKILAFDYQILHITT